MKTKEKYRLTALDSWHEIYDEETNKTLYFKGKSLEEAETKSENVDFNEYEDGKKVYAKGGTNKNMFN